MNKASLKKRLTLCLSLFLGITAMMAQGNVNFTIMGKVTDAKKQPLVSATIQIAGTTLGTLSDVEGNYSFTGSLPASTQRLAFSFIGYGTRYTNVDFSANSSKLTMDAVMTVT